MRTRTRPGAHCPLRRGAGAVCGVRCAGARGAIGPGREGEERHGEGNPNALPTRALRGSYALPTLLLIISLLSLYAWAGALGKNRTLICYTYIALCTDCGVLRGDRVGGAMGKICSRKALGGIKTKNKK